MTRKLTVLVFCVFLHSSLGSRIRFDQPFHEPIYRNDQQYRNEQHYRNEAAMMSEPVLKREHIFPRDPMLHAEPLVPQPMRNEPMYGNEPMSQPQPRVISNEEFIPNEQMMPNEHFMRNDAYLRAEPILRREQIIRREPVLRREPFLRAEPIIRNERIFQSPPMVREEPIFRNQPNGYTFMLTQCSCPQETQNFPQMTPQDTFFPIQPQMPQMQQMQQIQQMQQPPLLTQRIICPKPMIKPQVYQPIIAFPRLQRTFVQKGFRPLTENIQFTPPPMPNGQEFNSFNAEQVQFSGNFQNQAQNQENTSEPNPNTPVTVRNIPQMPTPLNLAQMSSIC